MRTYHSVEINREDPTLIKLARNILKQHENLGSESPLKPLDIETMEALLEQCTELEEAYAKANDLALRLSQDKELALGKGEKQYSDSPGHLLFYILSARDVLLGVHKGKERQLTSYGFRVVTKRNRNGADDIIDQSDITLNGQGTANDIGIDEEGVS